MNNHKIWNVIVLFTSLGVATQVCAKQISIVKQLNSTTVDGCGSYLKDPKADPDVYSYYFWDEGNGARMNIDGHDVVLQSMPAGLIESKLNQGERFTKSYQWKDVFIVIEYQVTGSCAGKEGCEFTEFDATVRVKRGKQVQTLHLQGGSGC